MKIKLLVAAIFATFLNVTYADNHYPATYAMEALQCNFEEGKDMDDAMKVISEWKANADKNFSVAYSAWTLTPLYYSKSDVPFDFGWMGYTQNMKDMGTTQDEFQATGQKIGAKWEKVTDCAGQALFGVVESRAPKDPFVEGQTGYMAISSCSFKEGKSGSDLAENDKVWNAYNDGTGFTGGVYRWWPGPGSATNIDHDFYLAIGYSSMEQFGQARDDRLANMRAGTRPEGILNCDDARVYKTQNIRLAQAAE
jgi:hypothetical protein